MCGTSVSFALNNTTMRRKAEYAESQCRSKTKRLQFEIPVYALRRRCNDLAPWNRASYNVRKKRKKTSKGAERRWQERTTQLNRSSSSYGKLNCIATRAKRLQRPVEGF
jgi:hypothetical protein